MSLSAPTQEQIEIAIDEVVSAIVAYRTSPPEQAARARARSGNGGIRATNAADLLATDQSVLRARDIAFDPVIHGMKRSLTDLGKLLFEHVGDAGMVDAAERIANLDPQRWQRRLSPINSAWDGIGSWHS